MKLIVGLGNPGKEYENTRHNAGFLFIDYLLAKEDIISESGEKFKSSVVYKYSKDLLLVKPQTFMNNSGLAVKELVKWHKINIKNDLLLVHDDLDIKLGKFKLQFAKSPRDHNGVISTEQHLGTTHFNRLRIGVDSRIDRRIDGEKYVLQRFCEEELVLLKETFDKINILS